jgi:hypothetical protein
MESTRSVEEKFTEKEYWDMVIEHFCLELSILDIATRYDTVESAIRAEIETRGARIGFKQVHHGA